MSLALVQLLLWSLYLGLAIFVLVRGADLFLEKAKQIGSALGLSHFLIGILIVAFGTSLPELASSIAAVVQGSTEIVVSNVIGSNVTNILLIVGMLATITGRIPVDHNLVKTELPIFFIATALFVVTLRDGVIDRLEAALLLGTFATYLWYLLVETRSDKALRAGAHKHTHVKLVTVAYMALGLIGLLIGAHYTVAMTVTIATALSIPLGLISIAGIALGTSLPELFVSIKAMRNGEVELAIGNIFGSNTFNILVVVGIPALIHPLASEAIILQVGIPILVAASAIFFITGLSRQIMRWEGMMMLLFFIFFIIKLASFV